MLEGLASGLHALLCQEGVHGPGRTQEVAQGPVRAPAWWAHQQGPQEGGSKAQTLFLEDEGIVCSPGLHRWRCSCPPPPSDHGGSGGKRVLEKGRGPWLRGAAEKWLLCFSSYS